MLPALSSTRATLRYIRPDLLFTRLSSWSSCIFKNIMLYSLSRIYRFYTYIYTPIYPCYDYVYALLQHRNRSGIFIAAANIKSAGKMKNSKTNPSKQCPIYTHIYTRIKLAVPWASGPKLYIHIHAKRNIKRQQYSSSSSIANEKGYLANCLYYLCRRRCTRADSKRRPN